MPWTVITFGVHKGNTLPQIVLRDPDWFFWAIEKNVFTTPELQDEAAKTDHRARHVRLKKHPPGTVVEYLVNSIGKLERIRLVPKGEPLHQHRASSDYFDLSMPRQIAGYDKTGGKILIRAIKAYFFGDPKARLTRKRCEAFFDDDSNFD